VQYSSKPAGPTLSAVNIKKAFGPTQALKGVSLAIEAGEVHALLGENGSGKSTLARVVAGFHRPDAGVVQRSGETIATGEPSAARASGIGIVFQELSLAPDLTVAENLFLGRERSRVGWVDTAKENQRCVELLKRLGLQIDPRRVASGLAMAEKQLLEIAKALLLEPAVLIFDEPTACLTEREISKLFTVIHRLRGEGKAILYVTHHLREVLEIADRVSVMRDGLIVAAKPVTKEMTEADLIALLTSKKPEELGRRALGGAAEPLLTVRRFSSKTCRQVDLTIKRGEILGLYGVVGCGREEISRAVVGLARGFAGNIELSGAVFGPRSPAEALARGVGYLASDRKQEGVLPTRSVRENLMLTRLRALAGHGLVRQQEEALLAKDLLKGLRVKYGSEDALITSLSGGNQQKILFGRVLGVGLRLLVLEDPTAGIDIGSKYDLYDQIRAAANAGASVLLLSSDLLETLLLCDRVYAMHDGRISAELNSPTLADEEQLLAAVLGRTHDSIP